MAFASSLLITDVDDTIKDSRVRDYWEMIKRGPRTGPEMMIPGMRELLYRAVENGHADKLYYVSKIPSFLNDFHYEFLEKNTFPDGVLVTRGFERNFKYKNIKSILEYEKPKNLILIGDNGEADAEIYNKIRKYAEQRNIKVRIFIRRAYSGNQQSYPQIKYFRYASEIAPSFSKIYCSKSFR